MSQRHYTINEEITLEITIKVKLHSISNYYALNSDEIAEIIVDAKSKIKDKLSLDIDNEYIYDDKLTELCDYIQYSIQTI